MTAKETLTFGPLLQVKHYTKHSLVEVKGPVTIVTGKKRRLTFFEVGTDMCACVFDISVH